MKNDIISSLRDDMVYESTLEVSVSSKSSCKLWGGFE